MTLIAHAYVRTPDGELRTLDDLAGSESWRVKVYGSAAVIGPPRHAVRDMS